MALKKYTAEEVARMESRHAHAIQVTKNAIADLCSGAQNATERYKALNRAFLTISDARQVAHVEATEYARQQAELRKETLARLALSESGTSNGDA